MDTYLKLNSLISDRDYSNGETTEFMWDNQVTAETYNTLANSCDENVTNPLAQAAMYGRLDVMNALVIVGFDPHGLYWCSPRDFPDVWGSERICCAAIHLASHGGYFEMIKSLVEEHHVDVNIEDSKFLGPLHRTLFSHHFEHENLFQVVKFLVEAGADVEKKVHEYLTPLHIAASLGRLDICEYLHSKGAQVITEKTSAGSALEFAIKNWNNDQCIYFLLQNAKTLSPDEVFSEGETLLHMCAERGHYESLKLLCSLGWNPDAKDVNGETPIHTALISMLVDKPERQLIVRFLIFEYNASVNLKDTRGLTSFDFAVYTQDVPLLQVFLAGGCQTFEVSHAMARTVLKKLASGNESIREIKSFPRTLQDLCCFKIRRVLGLRLPSALDYLPLPNKMKDFVRLEHVRKMV